MARPARGRGRGRLGQVPRKDKESSTSEPHRGRKSVENLISEAVEACHEDTDEGIQKLLEEWEEEIKQGSEIEEDMENERALVPDPGNTRGRIMQFK